MNEKKIVPNCPYCDSPYTSFIDWNGTGWLTESNEMVRFCIGLCRECKSKFKYNEIYKIDFKYSKIYE